MCEIHSQEYKNSEEMARHRSECESLLKRNICLYNADEGFSCKKEFKETGSLIAHYHEAHAKYACSMCYGEFSSINDLEEHDHNSNVNLRLRKCDVLNRTNIDLKKFIFFIFLVLIKPVQLVHVV